jgi:hypothetical protein
MSENRLTWESQEHREEQRERRFCQRENTIISLKRFRREPMSEQIDSINDSKAAFVIYPIRGDGGFDHMQISKRQIAEYEADPDLFVAKLFGLSVEDYLEWIVCDGTPLCSALTKSGHLCRNNIGGFLLDPETWKRLHRKATCHAHSRVAIRVAIEAGQAVPAE